MGIKRGSGHAAGSAVFNRTVEEAVRRSKLALQNDTSVLVATEDVSTILAHRIFAPRRDPVGFLPPTEDVDHMLAAAIFGPRRTASATSTTPHTLTFGTHLQAGGASYDTTAAVTITSDATSASTASTIVARDANARFAAVGITLPSLPGSTGHTANAFDAYLEATTTTSITTGSGSVSLDSTDDSIQYTIIGRVIHVQGHLTITSVSAPGGFVKIALPEGATAGTEGSGTAAAVVLVSNADASWTGAPIGEVSKATNSLSIFEFSAGSVSDPGAKLQAGTVISFSATYEL